MRLSCEKYSLLSNLEESNAQIVEEFEKQLDVNEKVLSDLHEVELRLREMVDDKLAAVVTPADVATPPPSSVDVEPSRLSSPTSKGQARADTCDTNEKNGTAAPAIVSDTAGNINYNPPIIAGMC